MIIAIILVSCGNDVEKLPHTFSEPNIQFDKAGGDTIIVSQSVEWSFSEALKIDDKTLSLPRCEEVFLNTEPLVQNPDTCSDSILTVKYDIMRKYLEPVKIESSWFTISKKSLKEVNIVISPNLTNKSRNFRIIVDKNGTTIVITQLAI